MTRLILVRHGQSTWNRRNLFTGWTDVDLSREGIEESLRVGDQLSRYPVDVVFTSSLFRAQMTAGLILSRHRSSKSLLFLHPRGKLKTMGADSCPKETLDSCIPTYVSSCLNERYYGKLQGMNKEEARRRFGKDQVQLWRRSYRTSPPGGESLEQTVKRTIPYFKKQIEPRLAEGKNVLVVAHGNSLRSIVMMLEKLSEKEVLTLEIPTGEPLFYGYKEGVFTKSND